MISRARYRVDRPLRDHYDIVLIALFGVSANLGLVNNIVSMSAGATENLFGIRDILMAVALSGVASVKRQQHTSYRSGIVTVASFLLAITPIAGLVGLVNDASPLLAAREAITMLTWALVIVAPPRLENRTALRRVCSAIVVVGVLVSAGVCVETFSGMRWRVVTPSPAALINLRSSPSGSPAMMLSFSMLLVSLLLDRSARARSTAMRTMGLLLVLIAALLTQSRTLFVGMVGGVLLTVPACLVYRFRAIRLLPLLAICGLIALVPGIVFYLGTQTVSLDYADSFTRRYSVLRSVQSAEEYSEIDGRREEAGWAVQAVLESPLLVTGLGAPFKRWALKPDNDIVTHQIFAFFLTRYGPLGVILFLAFSLYIVRSLYRAVKDKSPMAPLGVGLASGMVNLIICAQFGNVFGMTYCVQQAMIAVACLLAYERLVRVERSSWSPEAVPSYAKRHGLPADKSHEVSHAESGRYA